MANLDRLIEWAEAGRHDDPTYCAGNEAFAADVLALMRERDQLRNTLEEIAKAWPCYDKDAMRMVASDAIGLQLTIDGPNSHWPKD